MTLKKYLFTLGIPGAISILSLLFAWLAVTFAIGNSLKLSVLCAVVAFVLDSLDGMVARRTGKVSELGRQLDSMVDLINYSVYSAVVIHLYLLPGILGVIVSFIVLSFGILRLIRFNVSGYVTDKSVDYYAGIVTCHLSLATLALLLVSTQLAVAPVLVASLLSVLGIMQLSSIRTRKSGMLILWYGICLLVLIGAFLWLP